MRSEEALKIGFRKLVSSSRVNNVSIIDICREANVSRRTFYTVFNSKDSLVESILEDDLVKPVYVLNDFFGVGKLEATPLLLSERVFTNFYENRDFYLNLLSDREMQQFFVEQVTKKNQRLIGELLAQAGEPDEERGYLIYLLSSSQAMLLLKWISEGMVVSPQKMAQYNAKWLLPIISAKTIEHNTGA